MDWRAAGLKKPNSEFLGKAPYQARMYVHRLSAYNAGTERNGADQNPEATPEHMNQVWRSALVAQKMPLVLSKARHRLLRCCIRDDG